MSITYLIGIYKATNERRVHTKEMKVNPYQGFGVVNTHNCFINMQVLQAVVSKAVLYIHDMADPYHLVTSICKTTGGSILEIMEFSACKAKFSGAYLQVTQSRRKVHSDEESFNINIRRPK